MSSPYRTAVLQVLPHGATSSIWHSQVGLRRQFQMHVVFGWLLTLVMYPLALALCCFGSDLLKAAIFAALVSGAFMLVFAHRIRNALRRGYMPRGTAVYLPWSALHYSYVALGSAFLVAQEDWLLVFCFVPAFYCLFALFCSFNLWVYGRRVHARERAAALATGDESEVDEMLFPQ
jgi:hypothetical protein